MNPKRPSFISFVEYVFFGLFALVGLTFFIGSAYQPLNFWLTQGYWQEPPTQIIFGAVFLLSFGGIGLGGLWWLLSRRNHSEDTGNSERDRPWLNKTYWASPEVKPTLVPFASLVNKIAWYFFAVSLIVLFAVYESVKLGEYKALYGLVIPTIAVLIGYRSKWQQKNLKLYGAMSLQLDPYPSAIGGHCGGTIVVNNLNNDVKESSVLLQCLRYYSKDASDEEGTEHTDTLLWEQRMVPAWRTNIDGKQLAFCFDIPNSNKISAAQNKDEMPRVAWKINVSITLYDDQKISREYADIPVFITEGRSSIRDSQAFSSQSQATKSQYDASLDVQMPYRNNGANSYSLHYPVGRNLSILLGIVIGLVFVVTGVLIPHLVFNVVFPLLGTLVIAGGIYQIANSLRVNIAPDFIETKRYLFGVKIKHKRLPTYALKEFKAVKPATTTYAKGKQTQRFTIYAIGNDGQKLVVAENIDEMGKAEAAIARLNGFLQVF